MTEFTTPTGRLVWGDVFKAQPVIDDLTKKQRMRADGSPMIEYSFGVAFAKSDPAWPAFRASLKAADRAAWPQYHGPDGEILPGVKFADKITDGDGYNTKGQPHSAKDGYAGHWVVKFASQYPPTAYRHDGAQWVQITDPGMVKCGDYIQVNGTTQSNGSAQSPGMYRNVNMVAFVGSGVPIIKSANPNDKFGGPPPLPPGATATPQPPGAPLPQPPATPMQSPAPMAGPAPAPTAPPAPPVPPAAPPAPAVKVLTPAGAASYPGASYEGYIAAGWTDDQLRASGYLA